MYHYKLLGLGEGFDTLSLLATRPMTADYLQRRNGTEREDIPYAILGQSGIPWYTLSLSFSTSFARRILKAWQAGRVMMQNISPIKASGRARPACPAQAPIC